MSKKSPATIARQLTAHSESLSWPVWASYLLAGLALLLVLKAGLLVALFAGLLVYSLVHVLAPVIEKRLSSKYAHTIVVLALSVLIIVGISLGVWGAIIFLRSDAGNFHHLLQKLADIIDASRHQLPRWASAYLPEGVEALQTWISEWLREHANEAKLLGQQAGHVIVQCVLGMIIGSMVSLQVNSAQSDYRPLAAAMARRVANLGLMFRKIIFAQVYISAINTVLTAAFLLLILPLIDVHLPLTKSMIAITFIAGLLPVVGNILSNVVIVIVALSYSLPVAIGSLIFMIVIHKLEYFLNARIIGNQINAKAWEMLTAILLMETLFGLPGVVAAPVFYAYVKKELMDRCLV